MAKVYFTKAITPERVVEMYEAIVKKLEGLISIKVHSGEKGNQNFLHPDFFPKIVIHLGGYIIECNTEYPGALNYTNKHEELLKEHKWNPGNNIDLMDDEPEDLILEIPDEKY